MGSESLGKVCQKEACFSFVRNASLRLIVSQFEFPEWVDTVEKLGKRATSGLGLARIKAFRMEAGCGIVIQTPRQRLDSCGINSRMVNGPLLGRCCRISRAACRV